MQGEHQINLDYFAVPNVENYALWKTEKFYELTTPMNVNLGFAFPKTYQ